jgi:hypothetical protein
MNRNSNKLVNTNINECSQGDQNFEKSSSFKNVAKTVAELKNYTTLTSKLSLKVQNISIKPLLKH